MFVFLLLLQKKAKKKKITGISGFGFFVQKWPFRDSKLFSTKWVAETPIFIVFWGCALFGPRCQKREILKSHPKNGKFWLITEKLFFGIFVISLFFCPLFSFFCFFFFFICFCFLFFFLLFLFFFFLEGLRVRWGGPLKGHRIWP